MKLKYYIEIFNKLESTEDYIQFANKVSKDYLYKWLTKREYVYIYENTFLLLPKELIYSINEAINKVAMNEDIKNTSIKQQQFENEKRLTSQHRFLTKVLIMLKEKRFYSYFKIFDHLAGYNQDEDKELWILLRKELAKCKEELIADELDYQDIVMMQDQRAEKNNYWWYYPEKWI